MSAPKTNKEEDLSLLVDRVLQTCRSRGYVLRKLVIPGKLEADLSLAPEEARQAIADVRSKLRAERDADMMGFTQER